MAGQINLYDPALERKRDWFALGNVAAAAVALAIGVGVAGHFARSDLAPLAAQASAGERQLAELRTQLATLEAQVDGRKPDPRLEAQLAALAAELGLRNEVLKMLRDSLGESRRSAYADYLRGLARQSVGGLWLTEFRVAGAVIEIGGCATDPALLPEYIRRLNAETAFRGQAFANLKIEREPAMSAAAGEAMALRCPHRFALVPMRVEGSGSATAGTAGQAGRAG